MFAVNDMQVAWLEEMVGRLVTLPIADESPLIFSVDRCEDIIDEELDKITRCRLICEVV